MSLSANESQSLGQKWNSAVIYGFGWHLTKCHISVLLLLRGALGWEYNSPSFRFSNFAILAHIAKWGTLLTAQTLHMFMGGFHKTFITFFPPFWTRVQFCDWLSQAGGRCVRVVVLWGLWLPAAGMQQLFEPNQFWLIWQWEKKTTGCFVVLPFICLCEYKYFHKWIQFYIPINPAMTEVVHIVFCQAAN